MVRGRYKMINLKTEQIAFIFTSKTPDKFFDKFIRSRVLKSITYCYIKIGEDDND